MVTTVPPTFGQVISNVRAIDGDVNATLDCVGSGDPEPVVHWLRGDTILPVGGQQVISTHY